MSKNEFVANRIYPEGFTKEDDRVYYIFFHKGYGEILRVSGLFLSMKDE